MERRRRVGTGSKEERCERYEMTARDWGDTDRGRHGRTPSDAVFESAGALGDDFDQHYPE